jgi:hypothetical protein
VYSYMYRGVKYDDHEGKGSRVCVCMREREREREEEYLHNVCRCQVRCLEGKGHVE